MDKDLISYKKQLTKRIERIEHEMVDAKPSERLKLIEEAQMLFAHHTIKVRDFQHERLIHLLVTFFFAALTLMSGLGAIITLPFALYSGGYLLNNLAWTLCLILVVTEIFYIRHYYKLENGTQALYMLTDRVNTILDTYR